MKECGQDDISACANYGAGVGGSVLSRSGLRPGAAISVHANVDAPFRPLATFVPAEHWDALDRRSRDGALSGTGRLAGAFVRLRAAFRAVRKTTGF